MFTEDDHLRENKKPKSMLQKRKIRGFKSFEMMQYQPIEHDLQIP
jgi:hypothetical protein